LGSESRYFLRSTGHSPIKRTFDADTVSLGDDCPSPSLNVRSSSSLEIVCGGRNQIFVVNLDSNGNLVSSSNLRLPPPSGVLATGEIHAHGDIRAVAWGANHDVYLVKLDGRITRVDTLGMAVVASGQNPIPNMLVLNGEATVSSDQKHLFVGCGPAGDRSGIKQNIAIFDTASLSLIKVIKLSRSFSNLAWSPAGKLLLAGGRDKALISVDPDTLVEGWAVPLTSIPAFVRLERSY
jgi:hypothetical protein